MKNQPSKRSRKKTVNTRTSQLLRDIGSSFKFLRKSAGYGNSIDFAINRDIPEGSYGKHEAGIENMTISSLVTYMAAHGLENEDVFNKDFLDLGQVNEENPVSEKTSKHLVNQVRHQVIRLAGETKANSFDSDDIMDLHVILVTALSHSSKLQLIKKVGLNSKTPRFESILAFLIELNWIAMTYPKTPNSPKQKYHTTESGKKILRLGNVE